MRSSSNASQTETLKAEYLNAKKARKKAKSAYKDKLWELKSKLKPFKKLLKEAEKAERLARSAYKAAAKPEVEEPVVKTETAAPAPAAAAPTEKRKRGRQPGYSPKAAKAAAAGTAAPAKPTNAGEDDLTQVKGVGENIAVMLKANGVKTYADMAATSFARYKELLKANGMSKFRDPSEWAARAASLANLPAPPKETTSAPAAEAPTEKRKRGRQPGYSPKAAKAAAAGIAVPAKPTKAGEDDLTQVKGVGENIAVMLKANGVKTYADMAATSFARYKELLKANGMSKFRDPSEWAARAASLANLPAPPKETAPAPSAEAPAEKRKRGRQPGYSPKAAKAAAAGAATPAATAKEADEPTEKRKRGRQPGYSPKAAKAAAAGTAAPAATAKGADEPTEKKKRGRQPGYSPKAAKAATAEVVPVVAVPVVEEAAPKAPAKPKGPPAKPDDLTQVKGVGQRVADALNKEGIYTYKDMAGVSVERYKEILKENKMSKFRDPSDWARLAAELAGKR